MDGVDMKQPMCVGLEGTLFDCLKTINEGGQVYVVYPLIEGSEKKDH